MRDKRGFTLIETLVATAVLMIFIAAALTVIQMILQALGQARVRSMAIRLAQDRIEVAHNLNYAQLGTIDGVPAGILTPEEEVVSQGSTFTIRTSVLYIDDPYDEQAPDDVLPADYKRIRVAVSWEGLFRSVLPVVLMTDISPQGLESDIGGGTLSVLVFNAQGNPVENALVNIEATSLSPPVSIEAYTDILGKVTVPGAPTCTGCYHISVSKPGYTSDRTYGTDEIANPVRPHITMLEAQVSEISFAIDTVSTLVIQATRSKMGYSPFSGVNFQLHGTKEIGRTAADDPVYKVDRTVTTGTGGMVTLSDVEWDQYEISLPPASSVDLAGTFPFEPIQVSPGQTLQAKMVVVAASADSLLVRLQDSTYQPLSTAIVELSRSGYIATSSTGLINTGDYSQAYFPGITPDQYTLTMTAPGFETATASVSISGDAVETFTLATP